MESVGPPRMPPVVYGDALQLYDSDDDHGYGYGYGVYDGVVYGDVDDYFEEDW